MREMTRVVISDAASKFTLWIRVRVEQQGTQVSNFRGHRARVFGEFRFVSKQVAIFGDRHRASRRGRNDRVGAGVLQRANVGAGEIASAGGVARMQIEGSA